MLKYRIHLLLLPFAVIILSLMAIGFIYQNNVSNLSATTGQDQIAGKTDPTAGTQAGLAQSATVQAATDEVSDHAHVNVDDRIAAALEQIRSSDVGARIGGIQTLTRVSPPDAVSVLYESFSRLESEPDIEGMIVLGMLNLAKADGYFTDSDLRHIYQNIQNDNISGRAARILAARGDDSLLIEHIDKFKWNGEGYSTESALKKLTELGALQSGHALPHVVHYLKSSDEQVRLAALLALDLSGNEAALKYAEPLLLDRSEDVRYRADLVINNLKARGSEEPASIDMSVVSDYGS